MMEVIRALILTLVLVVAGIFTKEVKKVYVYILVFFALLFAEFFFGRLHGEEVDWCRYEMTVDAYRDIKTVKEIWRRCDRLTSIQIKEYEDKVKFHKANAIRTFEDAKSRCWLLPNITDRQNARYCFGALMAALIVSNPMSRVVAIIGATLTKYGLDCMDEWDYINNKLYWSQYHYEMAEWYEHVLVKG